MCLLMPVLMGGCTPAFVYTPASLVSTVEIPPVKVAVVHFEDGTRDFTVEKPPSGGKLFNMAKTSFFALPRLTGDALAQAFASELDSSRAFEFVRVIPSTSAVKDEKILLRGTIKEASFLQKGMLGLAGTYYFGFEFKALAMPEEKVIWKKTASLHRDRPKVLKRPIKEMQDVLRDLFSKTAAVFIESLGPPKPRPQPVAPSPAAVAQRSPAVETGPVSDVDINIPRLGKVNMDAVAVVIGIKDYRNRDVPAVEYALNDARTVKKYLVQGMGFREGNIIFQENATKGDFETIFGSRENRRGQLADYVKEGRSDVFIYYTGHGAPDLESKSSFFVPADGNPNYIRNSGYRLDLLYENLARIKARSIVVVIDACFSGGSDKGMIIAKASPLVVSYAPSKIPARISVFASSTGGQISSWYPEKKHSLFTYYFLKALQDIREGEAPAFGRIQRFLEENVPFSARKLYGRKQTPEFHGDKQGTLLTD